MLPSGDDVHSVSVCGVGWSLWLCFNCVEGACHGIFQVPDALVV